MAIQTKNITLDALTHTLDDRDRVAAQLVAENNNTFSGTNTFNNSVSIPHGTEHTYRHTAFKQVDRYYLDEDFAKAPGVNGDVVNTTETTAQPVNKNFEILGTSHTSALATFSATRGGITITTATADEDQMIIAPHLDTKQSAWAQTKWGTENQVIWECSISTHDIDNQKVWAGLKLTNDSLAITDANSVWFTYATDATNGQTLSTNDQTAMAVDGTGMGWHVIYSIDGKFYTTNLGIDVEANTVYHLKIVIDSDRKASVFVNGTQYGLVNDTGFTSANAGTDNGAWGSTNTIVNGASGGSTSTVPIALTVDGTDARTTFKVGDFVHVVDTSVPIGKVKSVDSATQITLHTLDATIANDVELFNYGQLASSATAKSKALTNDIDLIPYIGIETGAGAAEAITAHWQAISRTIFE